MRPTLALLVLIGAHARSAHAGPCDEHLDRVASRLRSDAHRGRIHQWGWAAGNGAVAIGLLGVGLTADDEGARAEAYFGSGGSVLAAVLPLLFQRVPAIADSPRLDRALAETPAGPERCALVVEADRMLARSARDERFARGFVSHAGNVLINAVGWVIVGLGWDRWKTGGLGALLSIAAGEIQIYTRPTGAMREWDRRGEWTVAPMIGGSQTGLLVGRTF
jgi:hypothetical protein